MSWPKPSSAYWRNRIVNALMSGLCALAALGALAILGLILWDILQKGLPGLSLDVFRNSMATPGSNGGLANAIVGSLIQAGLGAAMSAPLGIMVGIYLSEIGKSSRTASVVRFVNDILLSAPSILIGLFVYQILVVGRGGFSGFAGAVALGLIALPIVARTTEDMLRLVPESYREGAVALGARDYQTIVSVVLPAGFAGILTGFLLAFARIAGETAPLIFTSLGNTNWSTDLGKPMASLPIAIYQYAGSAYEEWVALAWTGALIITLGVLALNIVSRGLLYLLHGHIRQG